MKDEPVFAYAQLNARILPLDRGERFEDPLQEALDAIGLWTVTGGGTMQAESGEIEFCGLDIDLFDLERGVPFVCEFLPACGAPKGSKLQYELDGAQVEVPFGAAEGLAIYFNGTDLPDEVYANRHVNFVYDEFHRLLGDRGSVRGYWQGPTETAPYLYGVSADELKQRVAPFMREYPLCHRARIETIA
jgi:hypothetical protein